MQNGSKVVAVCGSDAHAMPMHMGFLRKKILPYAFHFSSINNHLLVSEPLSGDVKKDKNIVLNALRRGNNYIGNDFYIPTKGFRFMLRGKIKL